MAGLSDTPTGADAHSLDGHVAQTINQHWQNVAADTWSPPQPSEAQLNKPVELSSIPIPSTHQRADELAEAVGRAGTNGLVMLPNEGDVMHGGRTTNQIYMQIDGATKDITDKEIGAAKKVFGDLSPEDQAAVQREAQMRHIQLDGYGHSNPTPHFDAYERAVEKAIAPMEQQRTAVANQILANLPADVARAKQQEDFRKSTFKAL